MRVKTRTFESFAVTVALVSIPMMVGIGCSGQTTGEVPPEPTDAGDGDAYPYGTAGRACFSDGTCIGSLLCQAGICGGGLTAPGGEGALCHDQSRCREDLTCNQGVCCTANTTVCAASCVDTRTDGAHCGACGNACSALERCVESQCEPYCEGANCVTGGEGFDLVAAGGFHTCGILASNKKVVCWGLNDHGQAPPVPSQDSFRWLSAGEYHTCGIRSDDKTVCWGLNADDQAPSMLQDAFGVVAAGGHHTCGVRKSDSKVVCWGRNTDGQAPPTASAASYGYVSAGGNHTCAYGSDRRIDCWGRNTEGQATPPDGELWGFDAGYDHTCGLWDQGLICWGSDTTEKPSSEPVLYTGYMQVVAGTGYSCVLIGYDAPPGTGPIVCHGSLNSPQYSQNFVYYTSVSAGSHHACAIVFPWSDKPKVVCWGRNDEGQAPQ